MSLEATGVAGTLGTAKIARENAGELDSPTSRERTLGHTVCRLLVCNMKMYAQVFDSEKSHHPVTPSCIHVCTVYLLGPGGGTNMLQSSRGVRYV